MNYHDFISFSALLSMLWKVVKSSRSSSRRTETCHWSLEGFIVEFNAESLKPEMLVYSTSEIFIGGRIGF